MNGLLKSISDNKGVKKFKEINTATTLNLSLKNALFNYLENNNQEVQDPSVCSKIA